MKNDVGQLLGTAAGRVAREAVHTVSPTGRRNGGLSGPKGLAAGAGLAALVPIAAKGAGVARRAVSSNGIHPVKAVGEKVSGSVTDAVNKKVEDAGGTSGLAKDAAKGLLPGGGGKNKKTGVPGVGKGRRMPVQQSVDLGQPIDEVYKAFTEFESWPEFMHRIDRVSQDEDEVVGFKAKIWGMSKEFKAKILEQKPNELIKWEVTEGFTNTGIATFHELAPRLTRIEINVDFQPGSLKEKAARGMRHIKRGLRADLHRFKAHVEMMDDEPDGWEGEIEDGEVKSRSASRSASASSGRSRAASASSGRSSSGRSRSGGGTSRSPRSAGSRSSSGGSGGRSSRSGSSRASNASSSSANGRGRSGSSRAQSSSSGSSSSGARARRSSGSRARS